MAAFSMRGEKTLAQVKIKQSGVVVFSKSRLFPAGEEKLARAWAAKLEASIKKKGIPLEAVTHRLTVGGVVAKQLEYIQGLRPVGPSLVDSYTRMAEEFAGLSLADATSKHFTDYGARRRRDGIAPATILRSLSAVSASLNAAPHSLDIDTTSAAAALSLAVKRMYDQGTIGQSKTEIRGVKPHEEAALLASFEASNKVPNSRTDMVSVMKFALAFPRRASELTRIRWDDIDEATRSVLIRDVKDPKRKIGNHQRVPLLGAAWDIVQSLPRVDATVLPYKTHTILRAFERARDRLAEKDPSFREVHFHCLRHEGITRLFKLGLSIPQVAVVSGHSNWAMLKRYTHISASDVGEAFDKLTKAKATADAT